MNSREYPSSTILVEGASDRAAVGALATRLGRDLAAEGVALVAMGGATNLRRHLAEYGPRGRDLRLSGLCDQGEEWVFRRACRDAGLGTPRSRQELAELGFFVCVVDLEDELIRALGVALVEEVLEEQGDLASFRVFQQQPAQRLRATSRQLQRFLGTQSGRKITYARLLVEAMDLDRTPAPLLAVLARA